MKRIAIIFALAITTALSALGQTVPASHFECTKAIATAAGTDCAVITLQIETAGATELRTWPGTNLNYQKAQSEWSAVDDQLSDDIATRNMSAYRRHIEQLARRGPVTRAAAAYLIRLSFDIW